MNGIGRGMTAALIAALLLGSPAGAGPEWEEIGDAGSGPDSAQPTVGNGPLGAIAGTLQGLGPLGDFQDLYVIRIDDPAAFRISTVGTSMVNTQLFLFRGDATGLLANDDFAPGIFQSELPNAANDGSGAVVDEPGIYFIAVTGFDSDPLSVAGAPIFLQEIPTEVSGPDGPGGSMPLGGWTEGFDSGEYVITLQGCRFAFDCPGDADNDGVVDVNDLLIVLSVWGMNTGNPPDFDENGIIDVDDLLAVLANWGPCPF